MRQIVLDTETTGLEPQQGHRIIEIGCVELVDRRLTGNNYHQYLQPDREIDLGAMKVHGITNEMLTDKPRFADVAGEFLNYVKDAELLIHNAPFDVGFLDAELARLSDLGRLEDYCSVLDTLRMAREKHPGQKNNLDALCSRYGINNAHRTLHGALLDAEILADVYIAMTTGQTALSLVSETIKPKNSENYGKPAQNRKKRPSLRVVRACLEELSEHEARLQVLDKKSGGACVWRAIENAETPTPTESA